MNDLGLKCIREWLEVRPQLLTTVRKPILQSRSLLRVDQVEGIFPSSNPTNSHQPSETKDGIGLCSGM